MHCGAGHRVLGLQTNGKIAACPITAGYKPFYMGDVRTSSLKDVEDAKILPDNSCEVCEVFDVCGGRCLYANKTKLWGEKGFKEVCDTVFFLVNSVRSRVVEIEELIDRGKVREEDFEFRRYNGVEIIP
jgi:radical SAM protein with 4Fe4S-binding SPASM domain